MGGIWNRQPMNRPNYIPPKSDAGKTLTRNTSVPYPPQAPGVRMPDQWYLRWREFNCDITRTGQNYGGSYQKLRNTESKDRFEAYADTQNFVDAAHFYPNQRYGEAFGGNHKAVQVMTLVNAEKPLITYMDKTQHEIESWGYSPLLPISQTRLSISTLFPCRRENERARDSADFLRLIWLVIYFSSVSIFIFQAVLLVQKFNRNEKIVDIELKFEAAPFPAITLCNLNPYKGTATKKVSMVSRMMEAFEGALDTAHFEDDPNPRQRRSAFPTTAYSPVTLSFDLPLYCSVQLSHSCYVLLSTLCPISYHIWLQSEELFISAFLNRTRREVVGHHKVFFEVSYSACDCPVAKKATEAEIKELTETETVSHEECAALKEDKPYSRDQADWCLCAFDRHTDDAWPCFNSRIWSVRECTTCNDEGICPQGAGAPKGATAQCYCYSATEICIAWDGSDPLKLWEYYGRQTTADAGFVEAMGFSGMATLSMEDRRNLSYTKHEFIHKCSFNGKQCDIENDFRTLVDPTFGNCFTYNYNRSEDLISIRAGPNYGLRLVLFVGDDELPTTEATGVRLTVHDKEQFPFPDTFGYSAQTGAISSFGLRKKMVKRLPAPYGACLPGGNMNNFIYDGYDYSVEVTTNNHSSHKYGGAFK